MVRVGGLVTHFAYESLPNDEGRRMCVLVHVHVVMRREVKCVTYKDNGITITKKGHFCDLKKK